MEEFGRSRNDELIRSYFASFASACPTQVSAHVTETFVNEHLGVMGAGCETKRVYEKRLQNFLTSFVDLRYDVLAVCSQEDSGSARYRMHFQQGGRHYDVPGMMWFEFSDGLISKRIDCWDGLTYLKQANASADTIASML